MADLLYLKLCRIVRACTRCRNPASVCVPNNKAPGLFPFTVSLSTSLLSWCVISVLLTIESIQVLVSMLSTAYEAHFNAPLFYRELKNNTVPRYTKMVSASFLVSVVTMAAVTAFGFLTFGGASSGYILNNYANSDRLAALARVFVAVSIVFSYPLCFVGLRDGIREMRGVRPEETKGRNAWTVGLIALTSAVSLKITDLGFVNSFCGALIGSSIVYIFPSLMILRVLRKKMVAGGSNLVAGVRREIVLNNGIVVTGVVMGLLGAAISVLETFTEILG